MSLYSQCLGYVAPFYNLALVAIVIIMFVKLFMTPNRKIYIEPWKWMFAALILYILEEILTLLDASNVPIHDIIYPLLEMGIIVFFIYMLLLQKAYVRYNKK